MPNVLLYGPNGRPVKVTQNDELLVKAGGDAFSEAVKRGNVYAFAAQAGVTTQAGLSLTTPESTLFNPNGSGKRGKLWYAGAVYTVVFAAVAAIWLAMGKSTTAVTVGSLATTVRNLKDGTTGTDQRNAIKVALTATLPAAPVGIALLGAGLTGAVALLPTSPPVGRWFNGSVTIDEGVNLSIQTGTASGASGQFGEFIWEEEDK